MQRTNPWLVFLLPFVVFMLVGALEPSPDAPGGKMLGLSIDYAHYPVVYAVKIALTIVALIFVWPGYRQFSFRLSPLAFVVGVVGVILWIVICRLGLEQNYVQPFLEKVGLNKLIDLGQRAEFNPLKELSETPLWAWGFLSIRLIGLALIVPIIEEMFLRGCAMRFVQETKERKWWEIPFGQVNKAAIVVGTVLPMLTHPEIVAAAVWFSLVTWLMIRTRNIWDCVAAHVTTNLLLGIYVVTTGNWQLM